MLPVIGQDFFLILSVSLITVVVLATGYVRYCYGYWKRKNVPYLEPKFPFGNSTSLFPKGIAIGAVSKSFYDKFKSMGHAVGGVYFGIEPKLVVLDPDLIRDILIKDFQNFTDRGVYQSESDPISVNIFSQPGNDWRNVRVKLTTVFTSAKMKAMFQTMLDCREGLEEALKELAEQKSHVDMLEVIGCFTTDVIGSCAFGIDCNSFKHPDAEFRTMGRKLFGEFSFMDRLNLFLSIYAPKLSQKLGVRNIQKDISRFFFHSIKDTVSHRERNNLRRNDLLQLLIDLKNSDVKLSMNELIAQVFLFFSAGFETSSSTTSLALFEISKNHEAQKKLHEEIVEVLRRHGGNITYDAIAEMKYLGQAVDGRMAAGLLEEYIPKLLIFFTLLVIAGAAFVKYTYGYWKRKKVPYFEPTFPYGNSDSLIPKGTSVGLISEKFYHQFKNIGQKLGGVYIGIQPYLVVTDPEHIKDVLIKDFQHFIDRGAYHTESEPLSVHLFSQPGSAWKQSRIKLTSVFTSAKMKTMFETILDCSEGLKGALAKCAKQKSDIDMLEVAACYTTDVIGSCAFGIECNSFKNPDAEFRRMGRKLFAEFSLRDKLNLFLTIYAPNISQKFGVRNIQREVSNFFMRSISDTVSYREKNDLRRNDLLQLLIDMKNSGEKLSMNELVGQVFLFFAAGFETSSSTTSMTLFEVSKRQDLQEKLRQEIVEVLKKHGGKITYDAIAEMKYLGQTVDETLRIWSPVQTLTRVCTKDYKFQNSDIKVEKGIPIMIPVTALHHDPEYWPDPDRWDPDRFSEENKQKRRLLTYLPFGDGPRNCIGLRFGLLQTKIALITVLSKYRVILSPKTITPLGRDPDTFVLMTKNRIYLRLEKV